MIIFVKGKDFSRERYELCLGDTGLEFIGEADGFSLPYAEIKDFCVTQSDRGKVYFTMLCGVRMYEGQIIDEDNVEQFTTELKEKLGGIINIEVKRY
ncbi:MAG: hypothetical protein GXX89_11270 [Clostridiales bacterium]|nr:hypothetical protein [Clostridiales bacterium]